MLLLSSDYDGTFDNSIFNIKVNIMRAKEFMEAGNIFLLNTGRCLKQSRDVIDYYHIPFDYLATGDGVTLYDKDKNLIYFNRINFQIVNIFMDFAERIKANHMQFLYQGEYSKKYKSNEPIGGISIVIEKTQFTQEIRQAFEELKERYPFVGFSIYYGAGEVFLIAKPKGINKSTPIEFIKAYNGLSPENIFTIGDELNDLEMVRDYNGFHVGKDSRIKKYSLGEYRSVYRLIEDINDQKVKRRKRSK